MKVKFYYRHATLIFSCSYITSLTLFGSLFYFRVVVSSFSRFVCPENQREKIILFEIQTEREKKRNFFLESHAVLFSTSTLTLSEESQRQQEKALLHKAFSLFIFYFFLFRFSIFFSQDFAVRRLGDHSDLAPLR